MFLLQSMTDIEKQKEKNLIAARFELAPFQTGALNQRLRPLGHATCNVKDMNYLK